ncbi:MAG: hypothetical protein ACXV7I_15925, partial [Ilumatobacteraceae bacterium]
MITQHQAPARTTQQIPPVGPQVGIEHLLIGSALWAGRGEIADVLVLIDDRDLADPHLAVVLAALHEMVNGGEHYSPQLVMDRLTRRGVHRPVLTALIDATTSGAATEACRDYAAAVVACALRRHAETGADALASAATDADETELPVIAAAVA